MPDQTPPTQPTPHAQKLPHRDPPDPGTNRSRALAAVLACVFYLLVSGLQNLGAYMAPPTPEDDTPPGLTGFAKLFLLIDHAFGEWFGDPEAFDAQTVAQIEQTAVEPRDRLLAVIVVGEVEGPERALERLAVLTAEPGWASDEVADDLQGDVIAARAGRTEVDAEILGRLYRDGAGALTPEDHETLKARFGWAGRLALAREADDPARSDLFVDAGLAIGVLTTFGLLVLGASVVGIALLIVGVVCVATGRLRARFVPPAPGGSVMLSTFAVFLAGFLLLQVVIGIVGSLVGSNVPWITPASLAMNWLLLPLIFWPVARGMRFSDWRRASGWTAPRGVVREILAGFVGYLAGFPIFLMGIVLAVVLNTIAEMISPSGAPPSNPIAELIESADPWTIGLLVVMAVVWAPIVEETVFRGVLHRHLRARLPFAVVGLFTAVLFAFMHAYGPLSTPPLIALGFTFAMLREWRGSLIAPMVGHFLHNATAMTLALLLFRIMS